MLGWSAAEAVGRPVAGFTGTGRAITPEPGVPSWRESVSLRHREGHLVELDMRAALVTDAEGRAFVQAILVESRRMRAIERDLAALDALFTASPLGIAVFDHELRYLRVNEALCQLHGAPAEELLGRTVLDVLPPGVAHEIHRLQREVLTTGHTLTDLVTASPDGRGAQSVSFGRLTDRTGRTVGVTCTVMDITERREALRKIENARQRLALLNDVGTALGNLLDVGQICAALADSLIPRFGEYAVVALLDSVARGGEPPPTGKLTETSLIRLASAVTHRDPAEEEVVATGRGTPFAADAVFRAVLTTGTPHLATTREDVLAATEPGDPKARAVHNLGIHSMLTLPLRARGRVLGLLVLSRAGERAAFDREDVTLGTELAARAGISLDNARLYAREREGALTLQRSMLPQSTPVLPGAEVSHRYLPSRSGAEIGGDWFDVIPLAGGRMAFVIGDVTGHGLRPAATMGQLRTAVRTLAWLDLAPADLLHRLNDLGGDIAQHPGSPVLATCVYAVYDPATRVCTLAKAGHLPPVLVTADPATGRWAARPVELPSGAPLGVDGVPFEERRIEVPESAVLVLYTDGLIETRGEDLDVGVSRLCAVLDRATATPGASLEQVCDTVVDTLRPHDSDRESDDLALLTARLSRLPENRMLHRSFPAERHVVRLARHAVTETLRTWRLEAVADRAELLVSELVTNAVRHARGPVELRMVRGASLLVEVTDPVPDPPRERTASPDDEGGRGLPLVARLSRRWGTRREPAGKTVWFELGIPD
jgi:PAS domain S-box-containing protein